MGTKRRQDHYGKKAKAAGYAARSVYKLSEIDRRMQILRRGNSVVDLGCFPGSWSRYVLERIGKGRLVGVDLRLPEVTGGIFVEGSCFEVTPQALIEALGGPADVLLSDMAPSTTGDRFGDHIRQLELARRALELASAVLRPGGNFVAKVFEGAESADFQKEAVVHFEKVRRVRPDAVRKESREWFLVGLGLRGGAP